MHGLLVHNGRHDITPGLPMDGEANITMNCGDLKVFCVLESKALAVVCVSCGFWLWWIWESEVEEFNLWRRRDPS